MIFLEWSNSARKLVGRVNFVFKKFSTIFLLFSPTFSILSSIFFKLVWGRCLLGPSFLDLKLTRLTHLQSFVSLFSHFCLFCLGQHIAGRAARGRVETTSHNPCLAGGFTSKPSLANPLSQSHRVVSSYDI